MHAVVCIKQVPDTQELQVDFDAGVIKRASVPLIVNPFDEFAIEEAVRLKEKHGGAVTALTMGPLSADEALRTALAMGCDAAVHLLDEAFEGSDTWATATVLAKALEKMGEYDVLFFGKATFDGDTGQVAPRVAALLQLPMLNFAAKIAEIDFDGKKVTVERLLETGREVVRANLPAVISVVKEINEPRYPSLLGIRRAKKVDVPTWDAAALALEKDSVGSKGSFAKLERIYRPPARAGGEIVPGEPVDAAKTVTEKLIDQGLI
ncbi:MAG: electron transfer flavoprotein subunit beta [candidate division Zixibacteria bacterium]|nr:electron transfer flavoprotein subunit beta [candidate division Zixibacteria bacterium]